MVIEIVIVMMLILILILMLIPILIPIPMLIQIQIQILILFYIKDVFDILSKCGGNKKPTTARSTCQAELLKTGLLWITSVGIAGAGSCLKCLRRKIVATPKTGNR